MEKFRESDVKPFQFSEINISGLPGKKSDSQGFQFQEIQAPLNPNSGSDKMIRSEREFAAKNNFNVDAVVKEARGFNQQASKDFERRVEEEVAKKIEEIRQAAEQEGFEKGKQEGFSSVEGDLKKQFEIQVEVLSKQIMAAQQNFSALIDVEHKKIYEFVKRFCQWTTLNEISNDSYLPKLLEKLLLETKSRQNILIKVDTKHFQQMPQIVELVESKLGPITNVRIEPASELQYPGLIIETENGVIDGSLEGIFSTIDKVFEAVVGHES